MNHNNFQRAFNWGMTTALILCLAFWVVVAFVGFHFLAKVW